MHVKQQTECMFIIKLHTESELAKTVVAKLRPKQEAKELLDFQIRLPDGTKISVDPPDRDATITIDFKDGKVWTLNYSSGTETLDG